MDSSGRKYAGISVAAFFVEPGFSQSGQLAYNDLGAYMQPAFQQLDLMVGNRNATVSPVDRILNSGVAAAQSMDADLTAKTGILRW